MDTVTIGILGLIALIFLIMVGVRVAFAVTAVGFLGLLSLKGIGPATNFMGSMPISEVGSYSYSALPMFILMGYFTFHSGIAGDLFNTAKIWIGHMRGGLPSATIVASAGFATVSGASVAATGVIGKIAIQPMIEAGVKPSLAAGVVAMGGCLAALIPPSTIMVIYGILTEQSIAAMLLAGILPGLLTALGYIVYITIISARDKQVSIVPKSSWRERFTSLRATLPIIVLFSVVIGGIYTGAFTPTEAAGIGAFGAFVIGMAMRRLSFEGVVTALADTIKMTAMIFLIMVGVSLFIRFLAYAGLTAAIRDYVTMLDIAPIYIILVMLAIYFVLGMFMDAVSMMMLTLPVFFPIVMALDIDPIWYGILVVKMAEIGLVSPPVGLNCFIVRGVAPNIRLGSVFRGVIPFIFVEFMIIALLIAFPSIITFIPGL